MRGILMMGFRIGSILCTATGVDAVVAVVMSDVLRGVYSVGQDRY
jgi:hypothetical protein